jgi:hypothetical protein
MVLSWLGRLHGVFTAWVLLFLISSLVLAAGSGFRADRGRYPDPELIGQSGRPRFITALFPASELSLRTVLVLDAPADTPGYKGMAAEVVERMVAELEGKGMQVIRAAGRDPLPLAAGVDVAVLTCNFPAFVDLDFDDLGAAMRGHNLFDYAGFWDSAAADHAGLIARNFARIYWPHWLDPELALYVEHLRERIAPGEGVLLVPGNTLRTTAARARWFLALNEELSPRRFYLRNPQKGTSFVTEYFEWVQEYNEHKPWQATRKVRLAERDFSALEHLAPTRSLAPEEIAAAQARDIQWVLYWSHQADFRLADWELVPLDTALRWSTEERR